MFGVHLLNCIQVPGSGVLVLYSAVVSVRGVDHGEMAMGNGGMYQIQHRGPSPKHIYPLLAQDDDHDRTREALWSELDAASFAAALKDYPLHGNWQSPRL